jgi:hypothetical protein
MPITEITSLPDAPNRASGSSSYSTTADTWAASLDGFTNELNDFIADVNELGAQLSLPLSATSVSPNTIGTGDKTFTVAADLGFLPGYPVYAAETASPGNQMIGLVKTYSGTTLVITVSSVTGSGSPSAWTIGGRPLADKATAAQVRANTNDTAYITPKMTADSAAFVTLTDAATVAIDCSTGYNFMVVLTAARTFGAPTNMHDGQSITLEFNCGGFTPSWNAVFDFGLAGTPVPVTTALKIHRVYAQWNAARSKWAATYKAPA